MYSGVSVFFLLFLFHAKSGTTNIDQTGLSDISDSSPFSRDSTDISKKIFTASRKTGLKFLIFETFSKTVFQLTYFTTILKYA